MEQKAVIDRIVDGEHAVLLVGEKERECIVPVSRLPKGARAGDWLQVRFDGDELGAAEIDPAETERIRERIADMMARLRIRGRQPDTDG